MFFSFHSPILSKYRNFHRENLNLFFFLGSLNNGYGTYQFLCSVSNFLMKQFMYEHENCKSDQRREFYCIISLLPIKSLWIVVHQLSSCRLLIFALLLRFFRQDPVLLRSMRNPGTGFDRQAGQASFRMDERGGSGDRRTFSRQFVGERRYRRSKFCQERRRHFQKLDFNFDFLITCYF
jgi:hypothetical protein